MRSISTLQFGILCAALTLGSGGCNEYAEPAPAPKVVSPNVILVVLDTLRADHLSQYGYSRATSSELDAFAAKATRFTNAHAPASWTRPSMASIFTGAHPIRHGIVSHKMALAEAWETLAERLKASGYKTYGMSLNPNVSRSVKLDQGFDVFEELFSDVTDEYPDVADLMSRARSHLNLHPEGQPFFIYLHPMNVHGPYRVPEKQSEQLLGHSPSKRFKYSGKLMKGILKKDDLGLREEMTTDHITSLNEQYDVAISYTTKRVAGFLDFLDKKGLYDDALVIIVSDHGEELFDHGGFSHGYTLYEEVLDVPLFIKLPGQSTRQVIESPASLIDLLPTILDIADIQPPSGIDGQSLRPMIDGSGLPASNDTPMIFDVNWEKRCIANAVTQWPWKMISTTRSYERKTPVVELYNLEEDPKEKHDLAADHPKRIEELQKVLDERIAQLEATAITSEISTPTDSELEQLKALGYLDDDVEHQH
jgi:arylsulfatase A-like enzyme